MGGTDRLTRHTKLSHRCTVGFCSVHHTEVKMVPPLRPNRPTPLTSPATSYDASLVFNWNLPPGSDGSCMGLCSDRLTWCCKHSIYLTLFYRSSFFFWSCLVRYRTCVVDRNVQFLLGGGGCYFSGFLLYKVRHGSFPLKQSVFLTCLSVCQRLKEKAWSVGAIFTLAAVSHAFLLW